MTMNLIGIMGRIEPTPKYITPNPILIPNRCGKDRLIPNRIPEDISIELLGPGVIDVIKANKMKLSI